MVLISLALSQLPAASTSAPQHAKVSVVNRVIAKVIDLLIVIGVAWAVVYPAGPLLAFAYSLLADGMNFGPFRGQSIGKKILRICVRNIHGKVPASFKDSVLRNAPVGVATFFGIIPVWGWLVLILVGVPLMIMEIYLMMTVESGHRLGDVMGDTEVIETKKLGSELIA